MRAKYEVSISHGSKVMAKVKVDNRQTNKHTGQIQYVPDQSIRGHKNVSANQRPGQPSWMTVWHEKHKLGRGR